jgi:hypothetical protein
MHHYGFYVSYTIYLYNTYQHELQWLEMITFSRDYDSNPSERAHKGTLATLATRLGRRTHDETHTLKVHRCKFISNSVTTSTRFVIKHI